MPLTESHMLALGTLAPDFKLPDVVSGKTISPETFKDKQGLLVMFICAHCPYVVHVQSQLAQLGKDYAKRLGIVAIGSNDVSQEPDDAPMELKKQAQQFGFTFPYCYDQSQAVAKAYTAACTPDFFLFNRERKLVYRGRLDASRPGNDELVTGKDLRAAMDAVLNGRPVSQDQKPSAGCNIKWKPGNEPTY